jgi:membrane fusion protein, multidrug efflux system
VRLVALVAIAACSGEPTASEPTEQPTPAPKPVAAAPAVPRGYLGVLTPRESHDVLAPFTSTLAELKVKLGDQVAAKQVIAKFDDRALQKDFAAQTATLRRHKAEIATRNAELDATEKVLANDKVGRASGVVSKEQFEQDEAKVGVARGQVAAAVATYDEERQHVDKLKAKLDEATVLAPAAGKVLLPFHHEGERVEEGQAILQIISSDDLYIKFAIPGDRVGTMAAGDEIDVVVEPQNVKTKGVVRRVEPQLDPVSQMILAEADLAGPADKLQGGQRCHVFPRPKKP